MGVIPGALWICLGVAVGTLSGFLGVGGGIVLTPLFLYLSYSPIAVHPLDDAVGRGVQASCGLSSGLGAGGFRTGSRPSFLRAEESGQPLDAYTGVDPNPPPARQPSRRGEAVAPRRRFRVNSSGKERDRPLLGRGHGVVFDGAEELNLNEPSTRVPLGPVYRRREGAAGFPRRRDGRA
jgi:hypothetical protein